MPSSANPILSKCMVIAGGYACLQHNAQQIASSSLPHAVEAYPRLARVVQELSDSIGARGAALGQSRDLANVAAKDEEDLLSVIDLKTSKLYVMAATAGWVLGGGNLEHLGTVHTAATHLGRGMQIKDDIEDAPQDTASGRRCNYATEYGLTLTHLRLRAELEGYRAAIRSLPGDRSTLEALALPIQLALRSPGAAEPTDC
jgi:Polyprenyl synthetase